MIKYYVISKFHDELYIKECEDVEEAEKEITSRNIQGYVVEIVIKGKKLEFEACEKGKVYKLKEKNRH